jgi:hypothetical protein
MLLLPPVPLVALNRLLQHFMVDVQRKPKLYGEDKYRASSRRHADLLQARVSRSSSHRNLEQALAGRGHRTSRAVAAG